MSTTLGKSAGIALLLAAGLLLALYAAGVFTARPASADGHDLSQLRLDHGPNHNDPDMDLTPDFDPDNPASHYTATFPFNATTTDQIVQVIARAESGNSSTVTVAASSGGMIDDEDPADEDPDADRATVEVIPDTSVTQDLTGALITITSRANNSGAEEVYTIRLKQAGVITDSTTAGKAVRLTLNAPARARVGSAITIGLKSFGLPENINKSDVTISDGERSGSPRDVSVDGSNVIIRTERLDTNEDENHANNVIGIGTSTEAISITISSRAGVKNPTKAGTYLVTVDSADSPNPSGVDARRVATVERKITVSPTSAGKNAEVTVAGTGFSDGDAQVFHDANGNNRLDADEDVLGAPNVTNGSFDFTTSSITRNMTIQVVDFDGAVAIEGKSFTIKESIKVTPGEVSPAENLTVELVDWGQAGLVTAIRFGGSSGQVVDVRSQNASANGAKITVPVPASARLGGLKVEALVGSTSKASGSITVRAHELAISPTTAVPNQEITIQGSGFGASRTIDEITFDGGRNVYLAVGSTSTLVTGRPVSDSNGNITITVRIPKGLDPGNREIKVRANNNRIGTAVVEIPKPVLTIDPEESRRGVTITVRGTGFASEDLIQIQYEQYVNDAPTPRPVTTANTDTTGGFTASFAVPSYARIGNTQKVIADSQLLTDDEFANVSVNHKTPKPAITLDPETAAAGSTINISGINFAGFSPVLELKIDDRDVKPVPTPATESDGSITMRGILVPQLDPSNYTVKLVIGGQTVTKFLRVTDAPVSTAPADVFEALIEAETLISVWFYDNENVDDRWDSYSPAVPDEVNDLDTVATGAVVWVELSEAATFQGESYMAGWSLIVLK